MMVLPSPWSLEMDIGGTEWAIIILLGLFLLFGSKKLPSLSKTLGRATGEYEKVRTLLKNEIEYATDLVNEPAFVGPKAPVNSEDEKLEIIAKSLGIDQKGKTAEQLRSMISEQIQGKSSRSNVEV